MANWLSYLQPLRRGTRHIRENVACQDCAAVLESDERIVAVVADGVSQYRYSEYAAEAVVHAAAEFLLDIPGDMPCGSLKRALIDHCRAAVIRSAGANALPMTEMDCTLLFVLLWRDGFRVVTGQLGDGAICAMTENGARLLEAPDGKSLMGANFTSTLLSSDAEACMSIIQWEHPAEVAFLLTTDGLEKEIYSRSAGVRKQAEWYVNRIAAGDGQRCQREIEGRWDVLASDEGFGFTDDMSLAAIVQAGVSVELPQDPRWLCICGARNQLDSTLCAACGKDFMRLYRGVRFKETPGGKSGFFAAINSDEAEEWRILREHCDYPWAEAAMLLSGPQDIPSDVTQTEEVPQKMSKAASGYPLATEETAAPAAVPPSGQEEPVGEMPTEPVSPRMPDAHAASTGAGILLWLRSHGVACCMGVLIVALAAVCFRCAGLSSANRQLNVRLQRMEQEYVAAQRSGMQLQNHNRDLERELEQLQRSGAALRAELEVLSKSLSSAEAEQKRLTAENQQLQREISGLRADAAQKEAELQQLRSRAAFLTGDNAALGDEVTRLIGELQQLQAECDRLRMQSETQPLQSIGAQQGAVRENQPSGKAGMATPTDILPVGS